MTGCTCPDLGSGNWKTPHDRDCPVVTCEHEWIDQGGPGDEWLVCDRCGTERDE